MPPSATTDIGRYGVFLAEYLLTEELAQTIENLGYGAVWLGGCNAQMRAASRGLRATENLVVATGIVNIWQEDADQVADSYQRIDEAAPGRLLLGLGAGHREINGPGASRPMDAVNRYLDRLDARGVPRERRILAALGPRMLALAAERTAGAHSYLVNAEHSHGARTTLGPDALLAAEHKIALAPTTAEAEDLGRTGLALYLELALSNYLNNLRRLGFDDADFAAGGSTNLVDALVACGSPQEAAASLSRHLDAGADHVAVQPICAPDSIAEVLDALAPYLGA